MSLNVGALVGKSVGSTDGLALGIGVGADNTNVSVVVPLAVAAVLNVTVSGVVDV